MKYLPSTDIFGIHHNPSGCCTKPTIVKLRLFGTTLTLPEWMMVKGMTGHFQGWFGLGPSGIVPSAIFMPGQTGNLLAGVSANSEFVGKRIIAYLSITPLVVLDRLQICNSILMEKPVPTFHNCSSSLSFHTWFSRSYK
jgi:hypothetical protein